MRKPHQARLVDIMTLVAQVSTCPKVSIFVSIYQVHGSIGMNVVLTSNIGFRGPLRGKSPQTSSPPDRSLLRMLASPPGRDTTAGNSR